MALALVLSALVFAPGASAAKPPITTYLALGDSLAFGYTQELSEINAPNEPPAAFEHGYVNAFAKKLKAIKTENNKGLVIVNNGCPGETTDSFIGAGALGKAVNPKTPENPFGEEAACPYHFVKGLPLHHSLGTLSQLESGISILNPCFVKKSVCAPPHPIIAVTLAIGANDELRTVKICIAQVKKEYEEFIKGEKGSTKWNFPNAKLAIRECATEEAVKPGGTFAHIQKNVETILSLIRNPEYGNYAGPVIFLGYYNAFSFLLEGSDQLQKILDVKMEPAVTAATGKYTQVFKTFNPAPEEGKQEANLIGCAGPPYTEAPGCPAPTVGKYVEEGNPKVIAANKAKKEASNKKEEEEGKIVIFPFNGEGDIHPTLVGAVKLGRLTFLNYP